MKVMTLHKWKDPDIEYVMMGGHDEIREIVLREDEGGPGAILISKQDVIALAKEFDLVVYEKGSNL